MDIDSEAGKREGGHDAFFFLIQSVTMDGGVRFMPVSIFYYLFFKAYIKLLRRNMHSKQLQNLYSY